MQKNKFKKAVLLTVVLVTIMLFGNTSTIQAQKLRDTCTLVVNISNLSSDNGKVVVSLHEPGNMFPDYSVVKTAIAKIENGKAIVNFMVMREKYYAVTVHHDINDNDKMDVDFSGKLTEAYLMSNGASSFDGLPKYEDARFKILHNPTIIEIVE